MRHHFYNEKQIMAAHLCDVCDADAHLVCKNCLQGVYCSAECQSVDYDEHAEICTHIDELSPDEIASEIGIHLEHADSDDDSELVNAGEEILASDDMEAGRDWLATMIKSEIAQPEHATEIIGAHLEQIGVKKSWSRTKTRKVRKPRKPRKAKAKRVKKTRTRKAAKAPGAKTRIRILKRGDDGKRRLFSKSTTTTKGLFQK
jgi:MYND finger